MRMRATSLQALLLYHWHRVHTGCMKDIKRSMLLAGRNPDTRSRIFAGLTLVLIVGLTAYSFARTAPLPPTQYADTWSLVAPTISKSAYIRVNVPDGLAMSEPQTAITFVPEIKGSFVASTDPKVVLYKPDDTLVLGAFYSAVVSEGDVTLQGDFKVADDPKVLSILPNADAETHENTKISVVFNRPMVPLSTLAERDTVVVPVALSPETPGKWVWKSTRLLQFIPTERLQQSTHYTVQVEDGLRSLDGLSVPSMEHTFTTRTLKQTGQSNGQVLFNEPYRITYNMPVNLLQTEAEIRVTKDGATLPIVVRYATKESEKKRSFLGLALFGADEEVNQSVLEIVPIEDSHGREHLWDIDSTYEVQVMRAYPLEGDINLKELYRAQVTVPGAIKEVRADSPRSSHVDQQLFDPKGTLVVSFYEHIDLDKTKLSLKGLKDARYGTVCKTDNDGNPVYKSGSEECEKVDDTTTLHIAVDESAYGRDEEAKLIFERIVVEDGTTINAEPIEVPIRTYPHPQLLASNPSRDASTARASLTELELCTNVPLKQPEDGKYREVIQTNGYLVFSPTPWQPSYRISPDDYLLKEERTVCSVGQFRTLVQYGLHPKTHYEITVALVDEFEQMLGASLSFMTEDAKASYARLASLQPMYNVTVPGRTTLTYAAENLEEVTVSVCKVEASAFLRLLEGQVREYTGGAGVDAPCIESATQVVDLPDTYFVNNYFQINLADFVSEPRGQYVVTLYHPTLSEQKDGPRYLHTYVSVTTLAVGQKSIGWYDYGGDTKEEPRTVAPDAQDLYWVVRASTLGAVPGASITPYESDTAWGEVEKLTARSTVTTGADGIARAKSAMNVRGAIVTAGGESAVVSSWADTLDYARSSGGESRTYMYTDRPIYRPGDTVHVKGIDRVGYDGRWAVVSEVPAKVAVRDSKGEEISIQEVPVSEYGTFDTSFTLPKDAALGTWYVEAFGNSGYFDVEEYVPAAFKLSLTPTKDEYIAGDTLDLTVDARYYFGLAVGNATAEYDIVAQDYHFDRYTGQGWWSFGTGWYYCYECGYGDSFVRRGTVTLDKDGTGSIQLPLAYAELFRDAAKQGSKLFTVSVRVKDESGRQVAQTQSVIVHRGEYYLGVRTDPSYAAKGTPVKIEHKSVDTKGASIGGKELTRTISKVVWRSYKRREVDGGFYWHNDEEKTEVSKENFTTDKNGNASEEYTFTSEGEYELAVSGIDSQDNAIRATTRIYIYGDGQVEVEQTNNTTLNLHTDKESYAPGENGTVIFESPFVRGKALVTVERGDILSYSIVDVAGSIAAAPFRVDTALIPNGFVSVTLLSQNPEVRQGMVPFRVATDEQELTVEVTPAKERYLPGEQVELTVHTKDKSGAGVPAEVSVAVVDLSVLALKGNPKKNPLLFFYGDMPLGITTRHNLKNILTERDIPTGTKGGGGGDPADLAKKKRGDFRDTAHWEANVRTDASGNARVTFKLPDNLTTWQIESLGVTKDLLLGVNYKEIMTKKSLMAIPKKPRFVLPGDAFELGAQLFNDTDESVSVEFGVSSPTLTLDTKTRTVRVGAHSSELVYVEATAPKTQTTGAYSVTFSATYPGAADVVEQSIPIKRNVTFETFATMFASTDPSMSEYLYIPSYALSGEGELTIRARATLAGMLVDGMSYMAGYPYGCAEQIGSKLASLSIVKRMRDSFGDASVASMPPIVDEDGVEKTLDEVFAEGLQKIYGVQTPSGGFGWYFGTDASYYLTLEVLRALLVLDEAGVSVQMSVIERAAGYIQRELATEQGLMDGTETVAGLALTFSYPGIPEKYRALPRPYVERIASNPLTIETLSSTALGYLALATARGGYSEATRDAFFHAFENRLAVDARGAYIKSGTSYSYSWYETPEKNNGLFLAVVAARGGEHPLAPQVLSWLMARRMQDGSWQTTNATFNVLDGVLAYATARKENESQFVLAIAHDGAQVARTEFDKDTIFDTLTKVLPIDALPRQKLTRIALTKTEQGDTKGTVYYDMALRYALPPEYVAPRDEGITVERVLTTLDTSEVRTSAKVGEILKGTLTITIPEEYSAVAVEDYIPAGFEIVNTRLATEGVELPENVSMMDGFGNPRGPYEDLFEVGQWYGADVTDRPRLFPEIYTEYRDDKVFAFADTVRPGTYELTYYLRALIPGTFTHLPATVSEMYFPEVFGRTAGGTFEVEE